MSLIAAASTATTAVDGAPAGGAAITQVIAGTLVSMTILALLFGLGMRHRAGHQTLNVLARPLTRFTGLPAWAVLPMAVAVGSFALAGVGFVWDVSLHIGQGRDTGPFGTPAHYLILGGIYGFVAAAWFAVAMPVGERRPSWIRITRTWYVPPAAIAMLATSFFSMSGFPLDDVWHNLFGQDVTLWGPTHLMMITGGLFLFFALVMLVREGRESVRDGLHPALRPVPEWLTRMLGVRAASVATVGVTVAYLQEFAYGVPQFRLLFNPTIMAFAAALGFVAAAVAFGRGRALKTWMATVITLGLLTIIVGPILGESTHHFPLFLVPALCVEAAFFVPWARGGAYRFAIVAGALIGTVGVAAELAWTHVWMPIAWPVHLLPEAMLRSVPVAIAGALIAAFVATGLQDRPGTIAVRPRSWMVPAGALAVLVVSMVSLLPTHAPPLSAALRLTPAATGAHPTSNITLKVSDPAAVRDADWFYAMSWQGKEHAIRYGNLKRVADGVYRTTHPVPVYGTWKTFLRLQKGSVMESIPVYAPADSAIPVPGIAALPRMTRPFQRDLRLLQRERKPDVPGWLFTAASSAVAAATLALAWLLGWALLRQARGAAATAPGPDRPGTRRKQDPRRAPVTA